MQQNEKKNKYKINEHEVYFCIFFLLENQEKGRELLQNTRKIIQFTKNFQHTPENTCHYICTIAIEHVSYKSCISYMRRYNNKSFKGFVRSMSSFLTKAGS